MCIRKVLFISPNADMGNSKGHFSTLHRSLKQGAAELGLAFEVMGPGHGIPESLKTVDQTSSVGLVYEGDLRLLVTLVSREMTSRTYFNLLYSMEFLKIALYTKVRGIRRIQGIRAAMVDLQRRGWVFSADSATMLKGYQRLGLPVSEAFPFSSHFAGFRDFSASNWDVGFLVESKKELKAALKTVKRIRSTQPSVEVKILVSDKRLLQSSSNLIQQATILSLPEVGERYLDLLDAKVWGMFGKSNHHLFGSSGRVIDIASNGGLIVTGLHNSHGAGLRNPNGVLFRSKSPLKEAVKLATHPPVIVRTGSDLGSSIRGAHETVAEIVQSLAARQPIEAAIWHSEVSLRKDVELYEDFYSRLIGKVLLRLALRVPRAALWKILKLG